IRPRSDQPLQNGGSASRPNAAQLETDVLVGVPDRYPLQHRRPTSSTWSFLPVRSSCCGASGREWALSSGQSVSAPVPADFRVFVDVDQHLNRRPILQTSANSGQTRVDQRLSGSYLEPMSTL